MGNEASDLERRAQDFPDIKDYVEQVRRAENAKLQQNRSARAIRAEVPILTSCSQANSRSDDRSVTKEAVAGQPLSALPSNPLNKQPRGQPRKQAQLQRQSQTVNAEPVSESTVMGLEGPKTVENSRLNTSPSRPTNKASEISSGSFTSVNSAQPSSSSKYLVPPVATARVGPTSSSARSTLSANAEAIPFSGTPSKRPASVFADERRSNVLGRPKAARREFKVSSDTSGITTSGKGQQDPAVGNNRPPQWYKDIPNTFKRDKNSSGADTTLSSLKTAITKAKSESASELREAIYQQVRHKLHNIAFLPATAQMLKAYRMLHNQDGLPQIFDEQFSGDVNWPWDVQADARELYNKWCRRIFQTDIMRGIEFDVNISDGHGGKRKGDRIDPSYKAKVPAKYHGNGDLVNGQWWPLQLCALRDGAHGVTQGGICGRDGEGAYSVIMSGDHDYPDEDHGDWVLYCGTDSVDGSITMNTRLMIESSQTGEPVRLIRSWKVGGEYAPQKGLRYDGLYVVKSYENLDEPDSRRQRHRFRLERCPGQDPIRGGNGPQSRPTEQELEAYNKHQRMSGKKK